jgi:ribonuclease HII
VAERKLFYGDGNIIEAGCDEAGRGCLAGPVVAAAVILPPDFDPASVNDSKQLTAIQREEAAALVKEKAIAWAIAAVDNHEIDRINILKASFKAMHLALDLLTVRPELLLIDGNRFYPPYGIISHVCIVQGDALFASIAAASILAKTHRDQLMNELHEEFPHYGWDKNKGYATPPHQRAIQLHGVTSYHRRSYAPVNGYIQAQLFQEEVNAGNMREAGFEDEIM